MPRNSGGTYVLPAGNPVVTGTTITSTWSNTTLADIAAELTNSLARNGSGSMEADLLLPNGTAGAPALSFASQTTTGLYLDAASDMRLVVNTATAVQMTATGVTIPTGLTVTQDTANATGVAATGNGTAAGGDFNGGATNGPGVRGTGVGTGTGGVFQGGTTGAGGDGISGSAGGSGNTVGVYGECDNSGAGVWGYGGSTTGTGGHFEGGLASGDGVKGYGGGTGTSGVYGEGGTSGAGLWGKGGVGGQGVVGLGGTGSGVGVSATGSGTSAGITATGGATSGSGGEFTGGATNGLGVIGTGVGNGPGGRFLNGSSSTGAALEGRSASASAAGGFFINSSTGPAVQIHTGNAQWTGGNPSATTGFSNTVTPLNIVKAWGYLTVTAGVIALVEGFNVASVAITSGTQVTVTFATAMATATYAVVLSPQNAGGVAPIGAHANSKTTGAFIFSGHKESGGSGQSTLNTGTDTFGVSFMVMASQ